jgi:hypothetical protein
MLIGYLPQLPFSLDHHAQTGRSQAKADNRDN